MLKDYFRGRIRDTLNNFKENAKKLDPVDKRIIAGLIFRKVRENQIIKMRKEPDQKKYEKPKTQ